MKKSLKEIRKERGMTQAQVAAELGVNEKTYRRYENGEQSPLLSTMNSLYRILNVTPLDVDFEIKGGN